eukprot:GHVU01014739.1.p1 GENE.GHVU01014739.1~~GHVU01014739.1.p1  ORF type:complete len:263 (+),score=63.17 GHVU01014739.1:313-1101(+)
MPEERPVPSRMSLQQFKLRKKGASQGHQLLKKKSDALTAKFRGMLKDIVATKKELGKEIGDASFALAKASWASGGDFKSKIAAGIKRPGVTLMVSSDNVAGVRLPVFTVHTDASVDVMGHIGVASGGQVMLSAREQYLRALASVVKLASLQTSFFTLDQQIKMTNRRVNALDNVVIPRLEEGIAYISKELDEMEREEFFRLKKIQEKKKQRSEAQEGEAAAARAAGEEGGADPHASGSGSRGASHSAKENALINVEDEDIVF